MNNILELRDLSVSFRKDGKILSLLENLDLEIKRGTTLGIVGESGGGKSILCHALINLLPQNATISGQILYYKENAVAQDLLTLSQTQLAVIRGRRIGFLFQEPSASMNPVLNCGRQIFDALPEEAKKDKTLAWIRVDELIQLSGLTNEARIRKSYPHELSGGMLQRVALAAAFTGAPDILIADEPTAALDVITHLEMLDTLKQLKTDMGLTLLIVSHDLKIIADYSDEMVIIYRGQIVESGGTADIINFPAHPYTKTLLEMDMLLHSQGGPISILEQEWNLSIPTEGCRFQPHCQYSDSQCLKCAPDLNPTSSGGLVRCFHQL